eukprot:680329-Rhodomonas_salina.1
MERMLSIVSSYVVWRIRILVRVYRADTNAKNGDIVLLRNLNTPIRGYQCRNLPTGYSCTAGAVHARLRFCTRGEE